MSPITYISNQPDDYTQALTRADTLAKLVAFTSEWRELAYDAFEVAAGMSEDDFAAFRVGLALERSGNFAGEKFGKRYGALMLPEALVKIGVVAQRFGVPWGCAYLRLKETGNLRKALAT